MGKRDSLTVVAIHVVVKNKNKLIRNKKALRIAKDTGKSKVNPSVFVLYYLPSIAS